MIRRVSIFGLTLGILRHKLCMDIRLLCERPLQVHHDRLAEVEGGVDDRCRDGRKGESIGDSKCCADGSGAIGKYAALRSGGRKSMHTKEIAESRLCMLRG